MPPKKSKEKKEKAISLWDIALANVGREIAVAEAGKSAFRRGREFEHVAERESPGWAYEVTKLGEPDPTPASPARTRSRAAAGDSKRGGDAPIASLDVEEPPPRARRGSRRGAGVTNIYPVGQPTYRTLDIVHSSMAKALPELDARMLVAASDRLMVGDEHTLDFDTKSGRSAYRIKIKRMAK